jgi:hypothetical protein
VGVGLFFGENNEGGKKGKAQQRRTVETLSPLSYFMSAPVDFSILSY